jgi:uncharacterized protein YndB with AHSA1/START domain
VKFLQWALAVVGGIVLVIVLVGLVLPGTFAVERSIEINAPARAVYDLVVEPKQWAKWSVWTRRDPDMRITYSGPPFGMGAKWSWVSKSEGSGSMQFTRVEPDRRVEYALSFPDFGMRSSGALAIEPAGDRVKVTWTATGDVGPNPLKHYLAAMMDRIVGPDFEAGLVNLKAVAESKPAS